MEKIKKKLLILQHSDETPTGTTVTWCQDRGIQVVICRVWEEELPIWNADEFLGLVICGGSMNVDEEESLPWLKKEKAFILRRLNEKVKTLGLCLGSQLIADVLGAPVGPHPEWEVGWHKITLHPHPLLPAQNSIEAFQWHGYSFSLPPEATLIASTDICPHQGYTIGDSVLAFQFHPESSREWVIECADSDPSEFPQGPYVQSGAEIKKALDKQAPLQEWYWQILDRFF